MKKFVLYIVVPFVVLTSCQEDKPLPVADIYQLRDVGTLATTEYTYGKILHLNDNKEWYKLGDRKLLISVKATAKAGVDLHRIRENDIQIIDEKTISIALPPVEVISFNMDPNSIQTEMSDVNGFRMEFSQEEKIKVLKLGENKIRSEMRESNILKDAEKNVRVFLEDFYKELGFETVVVTFKENR